MKVSRRSMFKTGAAAAAGLGAGFGSKNVFAADRAGSKYNWGHTIDFGEQYYLRVFEMISNIRRNEMAQISDISGRMTDTLKNGGNVWLKHSVGHMPAHEFKEENKGNPRIMKSDGDPNGEELNKGDVLVTNSVNENVRAARDKGVHVVGVPVNYIDNEWAPRGYVSPNVNDWLLGDVSSEILQSYVPYTQGVVDCPEVPEFKICPSSSNSLCTLFWMFQAEVANRLKNRKAKEMEMAGAVIDTILSRIEAAYSLQKNYMFDHAPTVAKMIGNGANFHVTSDHGGVKSEANGVAMGPMMTNAFRDDMKKGDVHLLATIEPDSPMIIDEAKKAREMGMFVVVIGPSNSLELRKLADVFIDNFSPEGGGLLNIKGYDENVATVGSIMNNWLMWIFTAQFIDEMVRRGWIPWFWVGYYTVGGREYDEAIKLFFNRQGF